MKGDFTRLSFDPKKHYRGVLMQQGRAQLDSDWNEQVQIAEHRYSTFFGDFVGKSGAPTEKPLQLGFDGNGGAVVKPGRYYVNGLLVENEVPQDVRAITDGNEFYLYYLDVWSREVAAVEDPDLREQALGGPDTTVRLKTEWRVDWLPAGSTATPDDAWQFPQRTGQMRIKSTSITTPDNRLYRVEIHSSQAGSIRIKWSRDNGSIVASAATATDMLVTLTDINPGLLNAFSGATLVEVCDGECTRSCSPGYLGKVDIGKSDFHTGKIVIQEWVDGKGPTQTLSSTPNNRLIVRRWDGSHAGTNLTTYFELEGGIKVSFKSGNYYNGDYWLILTRAGAILDWESGVYKEQDGIQHNYVALALVQMQDGKIVTWSNGRQAVDDLRVWFHPLTSGHVSKQGDVINGDLCIDGKLGVGFQDPQGLSAPLSVRNLTKDGTLIDFYSDQEAAWHIVQRPLVRGMPGTDPIPGALRITNHVDSENGLTIQAGGNIGIGTAYPQAALQIERGDAASVQNVILYNPRPDWGAETLIKAYSDADNANTPATAFGFYRGATNDAGSGFIVKTGKRDDLTTKFIIDQAGDVGIGTSSPDVELHIKKDIDGELNLLLENTFGESAKTYVTAKPGKSLIQTDKDFAIATNSNNWSEKLTVKNNGNVGIGTTEPSEKLVIQGNPTSEEVSLLFRTQDRPGSSVPFRDAVRLKAGWHDTTDYEWGEQRLSIQGIHKNAAGSTFWNEMMTIKANGNVGIGRAAPEDKLAVYDDDNDNSGVKISVDCPNEREAGFILKSGGTNKWEIYRPRNSSDLRFWESGIGDRVTFQVGGNVGIGTNEPKGALHVNPANVDFPLIIESNQTFNLPSDLQARQNAAFQLLENMAPGTICLGGVSNNYLLFYFKAGDGKILQLDFPSIKEIHASN